MINLICPGCNASLNVDENRDFLFCEYCGHKIYLNNKTEYTYHEIKDADVRKAEANEKIQIARAKTERVKTIAILIGVIAYLLVLFLMAYFFG